MSDIVELASRGHLDVLLALLDASPHRVNEKNRFGVCALVGAIRSNERETALALLERGADPHTLDSDSWTPLHWSCHSFEQIDVVRALVANGAMVDAQEKRGWTGLHFAASKGYLAIVRYLLKHGADFEIRNHDNETFLEVLFKSWTLEALKEVYPPEKQKEIVRELVDYAYHCRVQARG